MCIKCLTEALNPEPTDKKQIARLNLSYNPGIKAAAIASKEGLPLVSALPQGVDETRIAAMTTALFSLAERSIIEFDKGDFDTLYIKGSTGYLLVFHFNPDAVLTVSTTVDLRLKLIPIAIDTDLKRMAYEKIKSIMLKEAVNELTIDRKYLPEILHADQLEISPEAINFISFYILFSCSN